jgi:hypothetical protein
MATDFDYVKFNDVGEEVLVNIVPFSKLHFLPRVGDTVDLPAEGGVGHGTFDVVGVYHTFTEDPEGDDASPAQSMSIRIDVKRRTPNDKTPD